MIQNATVTLRKVIKGEDRPSNHGSSPTNNDTIVSVNLNYVSAQTSIQDFGISNSKMINIRTLIPLPDFDFVIVDGLKYTLYASQSVVDRRNLTLVEVDA